MLAYDYRFRRGFLQRRTKSIHLREGFGQTSKTALTVCTQILWHSKLFSKTWRTGETSSALPTKPEPLFGNHHLQTLGLGLMFGGLHPLAKGSFSSLETTSFSSRWQFLRVSKPLNPGTISRLTRTKHLFSWVWRRTHKLFFRSTGRLSQGQPDPLRIKKFMFMCLFLYLIYGCEEICTCACSMHWWESKHVFPYGHLEFW